jgi:hypothetical protein
MAIRLTTTAQALADAGVKILVHGPAGAGKTSLCATTGGSPVIVSAEAGLLSLRHHSLPVIEVSSLPDVLEAYRFVAESAEARQFDWVCIDSISEVAEVCLATEKKANKDVRAAYGALQEHMASLIRAFRDLPGRNVFMSCKQSRQTDELTGSQLYFPSLPGAKLGQGISYFFDEVFALRVEKDTEGRPARWLQTGRDVQYEAKDRSGCLDMFEPCDLAHVTSKIHIRPLPKPVAAAVSAA